MSTSSGSFQPPARREGFATTLAWEFTKIRSVRSTYWTLLAVMVVTVGFGAIASAAAASHPHVLGPRFDPTARSLDGLYISQLMITVLGALTITSEYSTGMIRTSLAAMPRRSAVFAAKAAAFAAVAFAAGLLASLGAFFVGQAVMAARRLNVTLGQPDVLRAVLGGALFLAACGLLALGLGMLLRSTAGAITAAVGLLFVAAILVNFLPPAWQLHADKWLPAAAGSQVWAVRPPAGPPMFSAWTGYAVFCGYAAIALVAGLARFCRRDA